MFAKVYQYKFPSITEAKVAASFCSDHLGQQITKYNFQSLNILIGKEGDLSIFIKFLNIEKLKKYENESDQFIKELKQTFVFKENEFAKNKSSFGNRPLAFSKALMQLPISSSSKSITSLT